MAKVTTTAISIDGFRFKYNEEMEAYECRGAIHYDDEHDEVPEPALYAAAKKLATRLKATGLKVDVDHSEKGWVEVHIL
jgi:hypothetical protein